MGPGGRWCALLLALLGLGVGEARSGTDAGDGPAGSLPALERAADLSETEAAWYERYRVERVEARGAPECAPLDCDRVSWECLSRTGEAPGAGEIRACKEATERCQGCCRGFGTRDCREEEGVGDATGAGASRAEWQRRSEARAPPERVAPEPRRAGDGPVRILFIGNSYTAGNGLAQRVAELARASGQEVHAEAITPGGRKLDEHAAEARTLARIDEGWDHVVLQEQSMLPAFEGLLERRTIPAARELAARIRSAGGTPVLFMTWGREDPSTNRHVREHFDSYREMQEKLRLGYEAAGRAARARVAPVGVAWSAVRRAHPEIPLYTGDGSHPSAHGSYLAACVIFAEIFQRDPSELPTLLGLPEDEAKVLRSAAARAARVTGR